MEKDRCCVIHVVCVSSLFPVISGVLHDASSYVDGMCTFTYEGNS